MQILANHVNDVSPDKAFMAEVLESDIVAALKFAGYKVTKPKAQNRKALRPLLNAVGKPLSPLFDPSYRMKYKPSTAHLFKPYGKGMMFVGARAPWR